MKILTKMTLLAAAMNLGQTTLVAAPSSMQLNITQQNVQDRILWDTPSSPYVRPVLITFYEKKMSFTHQKIFPTVILLATGQTIPEDFKSSSPFGKIPFYEELSPNGDRFGLCESAIIMDYIDTSQEHHPLRLKDIKGRAQVSFFVVYANHTLAPATHDIVAENVLKPNLLQVEPDSVRVQKILTKELPPMLDYLEATLALLYWLFPTVGYKASCRSLIGFSSVRGIWMCWKRARARAPCPK